MNYLDFAGRIGVLSDKIKASYPWPVMLPGAIDYAEQRLYRELDPPGTSYRDYTSGTLEVGTRFFTLPVPSAGRFVVLRSFGLIDPSPRVLTPVSKDYIDAVYPTGGGDGIPRVWATFSDTQVIVGPAPAGAYRVDISGSIRPNPLSPDNPETVLTEYAPDLFVAAAMVFIAPPEAKQVWEEEYKKLFISADVEVNRQRWRAQGWSSQQPAPVATPPREAG